MVQMDNVEADLLLHDKYRKVWCCYGEDDNLAD